MPQADLLLTIPQAARRLGMGPRILRQEMLSLGGINRTQFGYQASQEWVSKGLAITEEGQHWHQNFQQYRHSTKVSITGAGMDHLNLFVATSAEKAKA